ncbi:hypothetical protein LTR53_009933 [Teratosphaeriaceae sp. CCFEE 6253]|nr:hypothetical protein LTR53_009933 [Teratosphaeriaceae sp. CCFEE 6253]
MCSVRGRWFVLGRHALRESGDKRISGVAFFSPIVATSFRFRTFDRNLRWVECLTPPRSDLPIEMTGQVAPRDMRTVTYRGMDRHRTGVQGNAGTADTTHTASAALAPGDSIKAPPETARPPESETDSPKDALRWEPEAFRLFDLPSELRLRIYEYTLAPCGVLCLSSTPSKRSAVTPVIIPALLRTCRQVYSEADGILLSDNEITITVNAHDTCWPTISEKRLSQSVLRKIQKLCVILDCTDYFNASYADVDFSAFTHLVSLRSLRIAMVFRKHYPTQTLAPLHLPQLREFNVVAQVLERVPASTGLFFGTEKETLQNEIVRSSNGMRSVYRDRQGTLEEAPAEDLEAAARGVVDLVRGCKCMSRDDAIEKTTVAQ